jgi:hypothetical protein
MSWGLPSRSIRLDQQEFGALVEGELEGSEDVVASEDRHVGLDHERFDGDTKPENAQIDRA